MSGEENVTDTAASQDDPSLQQLRAECEQLWEQVKDTQRQLDEAHHSPASAQSGDQSTLLAILREKERRLVAEIETTKDLAPRIVSDQPKVVETVMLEELEREETQLRETLSLVESQRQELQASVQQERQFQHQLTAVRDKLQEKCDHVANEQPAEDAVETVVQELETKINLAQQMERSVMKKMAAFVAKHFPVPEPAQVAKASKGLRSRKQQSHKETLPLKDILLELMTRCVDSPNDPYLELTERHWPAYIELLLRCNIVLQHPDDDRKIKLVPFHL